MNQSTSADADLSMEIGDDYPEIREQVEKPCEGFPGEYWRELEKQPVEGSYPTAFIDALTEAGYLGALIPEEYGGSGLPLRGGAVILETINRMGCSAAAGHAQHEEDQPRHVDRGRAAAELASPQVEGCTSFCIGFI